MGGYERKFKKIKKINQNSEQVLQKLTGLNAVPSSTRSILLLLHEHDTAHRLSV